MNKKYFLITNQYWKKEIVFSIMTSFWVNEFGFVGLISLFPENKYVFMQVLFSVSTDNMVI